jgi:hypothetical protein
MVIESRRRRWGKTLMAQLLILAASLLCAEIGLRLLFASALGARFEPVSLWVEDPILRVRGNPRHPDHDTRGFRNRAALSHADIVAIGDSHTYGIGVAREEAWPAVLAGTTGTTVYSMAHGGYGPGQYERMLPDALGLHPKLVITAVFMGNDFFDTYALVSRLHPPGLSSDELAARAADVDAREPIEAQVERLFARGRLSHVRGWLGDHVRLYHFAHEVRMQLTARPASRETFDEAVAKLTPDDRRSASVMYGPDWRTILRAPYSHLGMNARDPRIELGFQWSIRALETMAVRCAREHVDFVVLILPTKESVFWPRVHDPEHHPDLRETVADEAALRGRLIREMHAAHIDVLDVLRALRTSTQQPYAETRDGHPNAVGHRIIAEHLAGWLRDRAPRRHVPPASYSSSPSSPSSRLSRRTAMERASIS